MMTTMTWNQFKEHVDQQLAEQGLTGDEEICVVDVSFPKNDVRWRPIVSNNDPDIGIVVT